MIDAMESRLCPRCGAYWQCDCRYEPPPRPESEPAAPRRDDDSCPHDWAEALGVDLDLDLSETQVLVCRLCGLYAVEERT
jgi:hypothetical protein